MADSDVSDIASPPSKKARQGDIMSLFKSGPIKTTSKNEIGKENKPNNTETEIQDDTSSVQVTEPEAPTTPTARRPSIGTPKSGKKRSREEIEANKAEREKKKKEKETREELRKQAWAQELERRKEKKRIKEEEKQKREEQRKAEKAERDERLKKQAEDKKEKEEQRRLEKLKKDEEKAKLLLEKEEQKRKKEEEKIKEEKQKEQARLLEEEKKRKKEDKFKSFFSSKKRVVTSTQVDVVSRWSKFEVRENQTLAPIRYVDLDQEKIDRLDEILYDNKNSGNTFLDEIKKRKPESRGTFKRILNKDDDCKLINPELELALKKGSKMKLLQFHRNYRPAYFGTFRKKTSVTGKCPFHKDTNLFDYDFDSDEEWDEPEDGEEIDQNDEKSDEEMDMEDDENNGFMVPHGYLSSDEENQEENDKDLFQSSADRQKAKQATYDKMRKMKIKKLNINIRTKLDLKPIFILDMKHHPINLVHDYVTIRKPRVQKPKAIPKPKLNPENNEKVVTNDKSPGKSSKKTPEPAPKTPKTPSILGFAKKVTDSEKATQLFNAAQKAAQRQREKKEEEQRKKAEAEAKKLEAEKAKKADAEKAKKVFSNAQDNNTDNPNQGASGKINVLTPKRKKKVALKTVSVVAEKSTQPTLSFAKKKKSDDVIVIE